MLQKAKQDPFVGWRIALYLGDLYHLSGDDARALTFLNQAHGLIRKGSGISSALAVAYQIDMEQKIAAIYKEQDKFIESETHYLAAEALLSDAQSITNHAYVYGDLAELYLKYHHHEKALDYAQKAEVLWDEIKRPVGAWSNWALLAEAYAATGQHELAVRYAQRVLSPENTAIDSRRQAHLALSQAYENRQEWGASLTHFKRYVALRDSSETKVQARQLAAMREKAELERLEVRHQQEQQLQAQRLLVVTQRAELDRIRAGVRAESLLKKAQLTDQQRLLEKEHARATLAGELARQRLQRQTYDLETEIQWRIRQWLLGGLFVLLAFVVALGLAYRKNRIQKRMIEAMNSGLEQTVESRTSELQQANEALLQKNRAIEEALLRGQTLERRRVATELHDTLGGTLATVKLTLEKLNHAEFLPPEQAVHQQLKRMMGDAARQLRRLAHNLLPEELERAGLIPTLQLVVEQLNRSSSVQFTLHADEDLPPLNKQTEFNLYAICLELCHNTLKHAQATSAVIGVYRQDHAIELVVNDNGQGFSTDDVQQGMGLKSLNDRAQTIGATVQVKSSEEGGTFVLLRLPLPLPLPLPSLNLP